MKQTNINRTGKLAVMGIISALMLSVAPMNAMVAHGKTVAKKKPCVITITAPRETGKCQLGPDDPPAKVVVKGWYFPKGDFFDVVPDDSLAGKLIPHGLADFDYDARNFLKDWENKGMAAWQEGLGDEMSMSDDIDPDEGETMITQTYRAYTKAEAMQYMKAVSAWAHAWKKWRGKEFGNADK